MGEPAIKYTERYTVEEWEQWNDPWELIYGLPYCMSPSSSYEHQDINVSIVSQFKDLFQNCEICKAIMAFDWQISKDTVVQPDVTITCKPFSSKRLFNPPICIFEILSPSTELKDRTVKYELYLENNVEYYVLIDPEKKTAEVYRLIDKKYELQNT